VEQHGNNFSEDRYLHFFYFIDAPPFEKAET
jgi:hypothetical protein